MLLVIDHCCMVRSVSLIGHVRYDLVRFTFGEDVFDTAWIVICVVYIENVYIIW